MRGAQGIYLQKHLGDFHLDDVMRIMEAGAAEHEAAGCRYKKGWQARVMAKLLAHLPDFIGDAMEEEEEYCPERGIGVKEAA